MKITLLIMFSISLLVLFGCGYYLGVIKEKYGKNWLLAVPIGVALLMFNVAIAIYELSKTPNWQ